MFIKFNKHLSWLNFSMKENKKKRCSSEVHPEDLTSTFSKPDKDSPKIQS